MSISCTLATVLAQVLQLYWCLMIAYAFISWVPSIRGRWVEYLAMLVDPVLNPVRKIIPPAGGLDWAFLVVIFVIGYLAQKLPQLSGCYGGG